MPWAKLCSTPQLQPCIGLFKCLDDEPRIEAYVWNALVDREKARIVRRPALCQVNALSSGRSSDTYRASSGCLKIKLLQIFDSALCMTPPAEWSPVNSNGARAEDRNFSEADRIRDDLRDRGRSGSGCCVF